MTENQEKPQQKIIVDDDWKAQAQAEKEKLAKEVESAKTGAGQSQAQHDAAGRQQIPQASFATLVSSVVTQILMALGGYQEPRTNRRYVDLVLAKHYIDTLVVLEEKTKGNLTDDEKKLLDHAVYETRMQYVQIAQRMAQL